MKMKCSHFLCALLYVFATLEGQEIHTNQDHNLIHQPKKTEKGFIGTREQLKRYYGYKNIVMIASPGRSGSTMLTDATTASAPNLKVLKTHLLPPTAKFKGKILFIFSNPDKAAESALHVILKSRSGGATHFSNVESSDLAWFNKIGRKGINQTEVDNLLSYDALGCAKQLEDWLFVKTKPCNLKESQILAIKYEHLWEAETIEAIRKFLNLKTFEIPPQITRGQDSKQLFPKEKSFKAIYNTGTEESPIYRAYDSARELWQHSPPFQFLKLKAH